MSLFSSLGSGVSFRVAPTKPASAHVFPLRNPSFVESGANLIFPPKLAAQPRELSYPTTLFSATGGFDVKATPVPAPVAAPAPAPVVLPVSPPSPSPSPSPTRVVTPVAKKCAFCKGPCSGEAVTRGIVLLPTNKHGQIIGMRLHQMTSIQCSANTIIQVKTTPNNMATATIQGHAVDVCRAVQELSAIVPLPSFAAAAAPAAPVVAPTHAPAPVHRDGPMGPGCVHIFIDHSNLIFGAKKQGISLNFNVLLAMLEEGRADMCATKELVGSRIGRAHAGIAAGRQYTVRCYESKGSEELVDDKLHAQILLTIHDTARFPAPQTLVLVTGDGNSNGGEGNTSFPACVRIALRSGWSVEVWSWRSSLHGVYQGIAATTDKLRITCLDNFYYKLKF